MKDDTDLPVKKVRPSKTRLKPFVAPKGNKTATGEQPDKIVIEPVDKPTLAVQEASVVSEAVLNLQQRIRRAQIFRKYISKIRRGREIALKRQAPDPRIKRTSYRLARAALKRRIAGQRGYQYQKLSPTDKINVDKMVNNKVQAIRQIAKRLEPKVRSAEVSRLNAVRHGKHATSVKPFLDPHSLQQSYRPQHAQQLIEAADTFYEKAVSTDS